MTTTPLARPLLRSALLLIGGLVIGFAVGRVSSPGAGPAAGDGSRSAPPGVGAGQAGASPGGPASSTGSRSGTGRTGGGGLAKVRAAMNASDPIVATYLFATTLQGLSADEIAEASKVLWETPGASYEINERKRLLAYRWGQLAGAAAVDFAQAQAGAGKVTAITAALAGWASVDPAAAKAWIDGQEHAGKRLLYTVAMVDGWARQDAASVTKHILELPDNPQNVRMMKIVAGEQVRQDPGNAGPWALNLPPGALREAAIDEVATRWAWADPAAAINWAAGIQDPAVRDQVMETAMSTWTRAFPGAAGDYLGEMPEGPAKDRAIGVFSRTAGQEDPEGGAAWAATISDSALREESLMEVARSWLRHDRAAAMEWLPQSGLSPQAQAQLQAP